MVVGDLGEMKARPNFGFGWDCNYFNGLQFTSIERFVLTVYVYKSSSVVCIKVADSC